MPTPFPEDFRQDVIAVARDDGKPATGSESPAGAGLEVENHELRRRAKQLEQENEDGGLKRSTQHPREDHDGSLTGVQA